MRFNPPRGPLRLLIPALILLSLPACAGTTPTPEILAALQCSPLIPKSYHQPIKGVALPAPTVGGLAVALDGQTARLDQANQRTSDVIAITAACDQRAAQVKALLTPKKPWWHIG